jgi:hypothetical protein
VRLYAPEIFGRELACHATFCDFVEVETMIVTFYAFVKGISVCEENCEEICEEICEENATFCAFVEVMVPVTSRDDVQPAVTASGPLQGDFVGRPLVRKRVPHGRRATVKHGITHLPECCE